MSFQSLDDALADFQFLDDRFDRIEFLVDLGRELPPMPEVLKTDATRVTGCQADVWVYVDPASNKDRLVLLADSNSGMTKGIIALILLAIRGRTAAEVRETDIEELLKPFEVEKHLTSVRTSGLKSMIVKIRDTAARLAA